MDTKNTLIQEWTVLHTQSEAYEKHALYIKLMSIGITSAALLINQMGLGIAPLGIVSFSIISLLAVLWLLEAIWKTFQSRLTDRILIIEGALKADVKSNDVKPVSPFQLHTEWLANRQGFTRLIGEYLSQAARPTVAFPYVLLIIGVLIIYL